MESGVENGVLSEVNSWVDLSPQNRVLDTLDPWVLGTWIQGAWDRVWGGGREGVGRGYRYPIPNPPY